MFQANLLIFQFKNVSAAAFPLSATLKLVLLRTPQFLNLTLPVGISLAASLAISRLARDAEINAVRSAGTPILRLVLPVVAFGVLVAIGNFYLAERVMPTSEREARRLMVDMTLTGGVPEFKNNVLIRLRNYSASFGSVSRAAPARSAFKTSCSSKGRASMRCGCIPLNPASTPTGSGPCESPTSA